MRKYGILKTLKCFYLNNRFLGKDGLVFNDGVGDMLGGSNGTRDHFGNGSGFMDISGLSNGVGNGRHLGGHLGVFGADLGVLEGPWGPLWAPLRPL